VSNRSLFIAFLFHIGLALCLLFLVWSAEELFEQEWTESTTISSDVTVSGNDEDFGFNLTDSLPEESADSMAFPEFQIEDISDETSWKRSEELD
jgi:hypothetical protein